MKPDSSRHSSGFNLVATATRDGESADRRGAVARSVFNPARAMNAEHLFSRGYHTARLGGCCPSLGTAKRCADQCRAAEPARPYLRRPSQASATRMRTMRCPKKNKEQKKALLPAPIRPKRRSPVDALARRRPKGVPPHAGEATWASTVPGLYRDQSAVAGAGRAGGMWRAAEAQGCQ